MIFYLHACTLLGTIQNLLYHRVGANQFLTVKKNACPLKIGVKNLKPRSELYLKKVAAPLVTKRKLVLSEENRWIYTVQSNVFIQNQKKSLK